MLRGFGVRTVMEVANTSETSINFYQTRRRNIAEDSNTVWRKNLKSHKHVEKL